MSEKKPIVFIFHGYGANGDDLKPLSSVLDPHQHYHWEFPNGPLELPHFFMGQARAWFPIDEARLNQQIQTGQKRDFQNREFKGAHKVLQEIVNWIETFDLSKGFILGGFSQGSMLTVHLSQLLVQKPLGLLLFSGAIVDRKRLEVTGNQYPYPVFISHGNRDEIIPLEEGEYLKKFLENQGGEVSFHPFQGGHEIPREILEPARNFLEKAVYKSS